MSFLTQTWNSYSTSPFQTFSNSPLVRPQIQPKHLSCVSLSCLHMAAKVTEEECNLTPTDELIRIGQCRFTVSDLSRMEKIVAKKLNFKSNAITALTFLHLYHQIILSHSTARWAHHLQKIMCSLTLCKVYIPADCFPNHFRWFISLHFD